MPIELQDIPIITKNQIRKLIIIGTHLHQWQGTDTNDLSRVMKEQGIIQLDPLNPAGRSHDHFLFARLPTYTQGLMEQILYPKAEVFESYFHSLDVVSRDFISLFFIFSS